MILYYLLDELNTLKKALCDSECCLKSSFNLLDQRETRREINFPIALFEDANDSLDVAEVPDKCV